MRRVLSLAYTFAVAGMEPERQARFDDLMSDEPTVLPASAGHPAVAVAKPRTEQERQLLARGKRPPPWWTGAQSVDSVSHLMVQGGEQ